MQATSVCLTVLESACEIMWFCVWLTSFSSPWVHPCCCIWQNFVLFMVECMSVYDVYIYNVYIKYIYKKVGFLTSLLLDA